MGCDAPSFGLEAPSPATSGSGTPNGPSCTGIPLFVYSGLTFSEGRPKLCEIIEKLAMILEKIVIGITELLKHIPF